MGDRTTVVLTLRRADHDKVKNEPWFDDAEPEAQGIASPAFGGDSRSLTDTDSTVALTYEEVNYGELGFLHELQQRGIAYDSDWSGGDTYPEGCETCRFNEDGEIQVLNLSDGDENPPINELMARLTKPHQLIEYIKAHKARTTPWPWENQGEYGKRFLAKQLLQPNKE